MRTLVFVDSNVLLDFYRCRGKEPHSLLTYLTLKNNSFITTEQVRMEFLKNRIKVINDELSVIAGVNVSGQFNVPPFLRLDEAFKDLREAKNRFDEKANIIRGKLTELIFGSDESDVVLKTVDRLFSESNPSHLVGAGKVFERTKRRALNRFLLNMPPRKANDTSIGDAMNWEWILHCAKVTGSSVVIVTRDSDYGIRSGSEMIVNDWLKSEFEQLVGNSCSVKLTLYLSEALEIAGIPINPDERKAEIEEVERIIQDAFLTLTPLEEKVIRMRTGYGTHVDGLNNLLAVLGAKGHI